MFYKRQVNKKVEKKVEKPVTPPTPSVMCLGLGRFKRTDLSLVPADYCKNLVDSPLFFFLTWDEKEALKELGFVRSSKNPTTRMPRMEATRTDSSTVKQLKEAFNSYCEWISHGMPSEAWSYTTATFYVVSKTLFVRAEREGLELPQDQLNVAKALSLQERFFAARFGSQDRRTEAVWLATVKALDDLFFSTTGAADKDVSILTAMIDRELEMS